MDTREGTIDDIIWCHYDLGSDVLSPCLASPRDVKAFGKEAPDGFILLRTAADVVIGIMVVD